MVNKIFDEFNNLAISRQRRYQLRKIRDKKCIVCGGELSPNKISERFCEKCSPKRGIGKGIKK